MVDDWGQTSDLLHVNHETVEARLRESRLAGLGTPGGNVLRGSLQRSGRP